MLLPFSLCARYTRRQVAERETMLGELDDEVLL